MVLPAVLRNPARHSQQASWRDRACRLDHRARLHAVARHVAGAFGKLSAAIPAVPVHLLRRGNRAWLSRLAGADRRLWDCGGPPHALLFCFLFRPPSAPWLVLETEAVANLDLGIGAAARRSSRNIGAAGGARVKEPRA